jgi:cytochrome c-type biogenesis protein CcmH/NrfG
MENPRENPPHLNQPANSLPESTGMTVSNRRQKIEQMLQVEPQDIFLRYSLAMEMSNEGHLEQALAILQELCKATPPYVPAFFRSAQMLSDADQVEPARSFLRDGIEAARAQGDLHAAAEMGEMLADLGGSM